MNTTLLCIILILFHIVFSSVCYIKNNFTNASLKRLLWFHSFMGGAYVCNVYNHNNYNENVDEIDYTLFV